MRDVIVFRSGPSSDKLVADMESLSVGPGDADPPAVRANNKFLADITSSMGSLSMESNQLIELLLTKEKIDITPANIEGIYNNLQSMRTSESTSAPSTPAAKIESSTLEPSKPQFQTTTPFLQKNAEAAATEVSTLPIDDDLICNMFKDQKLVVPSKIIKQLHGTCYFHSCLNFVRNATFNYQTNLQTDWFIHPFLSTENEFRNYKQLLKRMRLIYQTRYFNSFPKRDQNFAKSGLASVVIRALFEMGYFKNAVFIEVAGGVPKDFIGDLNILYFSRRINSEKFCLDGTEKTLLIEYKVEDKVHTQDFKEFCDEKSTGTLVGGILGIIIPDDLKKSHFVSFVIEKAEKAEKANITWLNSSKDVLRTPNETLSSYISQFQSSNNPMLGELLLFFETKKKEDDVIKCSKDQRVSRTKSVPARLR